MNSDSKTNLVPPALRKTLNANPKAKAAFSKLPYSHKREYVSWITSAKKEETVQRRLKQFVPMLLAKQKH
jgi:uncharacterized protein YdeI (YjbR/CyaY-like superfamily)